MGLFLVFYAVIAASCATLTTKTLIGYLDVSKYVKVSVVIFITACWFAPVFIKVLKTLYSNVPCIIQISHIIYFFFGLAFILFAVLLTRDIAWYLGYFAKLLPDPKNIYWLSRLNIAAVVLSLIIALYSFYEGTKEASVKNVTIYSNKVTEDIKLALITDLHINQGTTKKRLHNLIARVNKLDADALLLVGDIIDDRLDILEDKFDILDGFRTKYGNYISFGNHELYNGLSQWRAKFNSMENIKLLDNLSFDISEKNLNITGIPDTRIFRNFKEYVPNFDEIMKDVSEERYKVILSHAPDVAIALPQGMFDLQVSGHTHGGQIFPFHILAKMENKFLAGLYDVNETKLYVSRGTGYWGPPVRFLAPSEITLITIKKETSNK